MSQKHVHQVTPLHKGKSGFFADDEEVSPSSGAGESKKKNSNAGLIPAKKEPSVRDLMGGIYEEEEGDDDKMYAHELPPDPFMQKLTIDEDEEEDEDYNSDFLEESAATVSPGKPQQQKKKVPSSPSAQMTQIVSPISSGLTTPSKKKSSTTTTNNNMNSNTTSSILKDANSNIDALLEKVNIVTSSTTSALPISVSVPTLKTTSPPSSLSKPTNTSARKHSGSPRASRSPRSNSSTNNKRIKSAQKLRQSPIRVQTQDTGDNNSNKPTNTSVCTPKHSPQKTAPYQEDNDFEFDFEDDFGGDEGGGGGGPSKKAGGEEGAVGGKEENDDLYETFDPLKEVNTDGEDSSNLIEGKIEGMTLEVYMMEYTKAKALDEALDEESGEDKSPAVVDPQGLDGWSPGPGQRHINGTDSPFRIDMSEFEGHDFDDGSDDLYEADNDHDVEEEGGENEESSSHNNEILANILTQVQDVQNKLEVLSSSQKITSASPTKQHAASHKGAMKKDVSFNSDNNSTNKNKNNKNNKNSSFQHSPIEKYPGKAAGEGGGGHQSISEKVAAGVHASRMSNNEASSVNSSLSGGGSGKADKNSAHTSNNTSANASHNNNSDVVITNNTPLDVKVDVLKKQLKKKIEEGKKMEDRMKRMEKDMEKMNSQWQEAEESLKVTTKKMNKAHKAKLTAQKKVAEMTQEMLHYESLIQAVEQLRENESLLLQKVSQLEEQNMETARALKASMSRELEWRSLYKKEHAQDSHQDHSGHNQHNHNHPKILPGASTGMNSHRSLPDQERPNVRQSKPIYERNSITEGRQKKKKKKSSSKERDGDGNNRQKILPILISKQRK